MNEICPAGSNCISYLWCANGIVTNIRAGLDLIGPSFEEVYSGIYEVIIPQSFIILLGS